LERFWGAAVYARTVAATTLWLMVGERLAWLSVMSLMWTKIRPGTAVRYFMM
jgi:hypothetical protein